jgi:addiction module HigA family antidote
MFDMQLLQRGNLGLPLRVLKLSKTKLAKKIKPAHPGEHLREDFLKPYGLSKSKLAMELRVPVTRIADILAERRGITADTALRLGRYFKTSAQFWMNMQMEFELDVAEDELLAEIERDVRPTSTEPRA